MGCDIHGFVQFTVASDPSNPEPTQIDHLFSKSFGINRDYALFTHLAGVRGNSISDIFMESPAVPKGLNEVYGDNYFRIPLRYWPKYPPRGYPEPLANEILEHTPADCHSASYLDTTELMIVALRYAQCFELDATDEGRAIRATCFDSGDWEHMNDYYEACQAPFAWVRRLGRKGMHQDLKPIIDLMQDVDINGGKPLFVFCFDN